MLWCSLGALTGETLAKTPKTIPRWPRRQCWAGTARCMGKRMKVATIPHGIVSSLDAHLVSPGTVGVGEKSPLPNCNGDQTSPNPQDKHLFQYNSECSPSHGVESKNNPSSNHPPGKNHEANSIPNHLIPKSPPSHRFNPSRFPPTNISRDQVDDFPADSGGPTWELAPRIVVDQLGTWRVKDPTKTKTKHVRNLCFQTCFRKTFWKKNTCGHVVCNRIP